MLVRHESTEPDGDRKTTFEELPEPSAELTDLGDILFRSLFCAFVSCMSSAIVHTLVSLFPTPVSGRYSWR